MTALRNIQNHFYEGGNEMTDTPQAANPDIPKDTNSLVNKIQAGFEAILQAISGLNASQVSVPDQGGWSIKDNLAHLTVWEKIMLQADLDHQPAHQVLQLDEQRLKGMNEDAINAVIYERNQGRTYEAVLADFQQTTQQAIERLQALPFSELMGPAGREDPENRPLLLWVAGNTYEHFEEHLPRIQDQAKRVAL